METAHRTARAAGLAYVVLVVTALFALMYVPGQLFVRGDPAATYANIVAHESMFRLGIVANVVGHVAFLVLPLILYRLLSPVHREAAVLMVAFAVAAVPIDFVAIAHQLDVLRLLQQAPDARTLTLEQTQAQVQLSLWSYGNRLLIAQVFWGLWLLPFGWLVFKSGFLPKLLGVFLMAGCLSYLFRFVAAVMFPEFEVPRLVRLPASIGEIGIAFWLLAFGARRFLVTRT